VAGVDEYGNAGTELSNVAAQLQIFAGAVGQGDDEGSYFGGDACDERPRPEVCRSAVGGDMSPRGYRRPSAATTPRA
jgi:hypothetical protein